MHMHADLPQPPRSHLSALAWPAPNRFKLGRWCCGCEPATHPTRRHLSLQVQGAARGHLLVPFARGPANGGWTAWSFDHQGTPHELGMHGAMITAGCMHEDGHQFKVQHACGHTFGTMRMWASGMRMGCMGMKCNSAPQGHAAQCATLHSSSMRTACCPCACRKAHSSVRQSLYVHAGVAFICF